MSKIAISDAAKRDLRNFVDSSVLDTMRDRLPRARSDFVHVKMTEALVALRSRAHWLIDNADDMRELMKQPLAVEGMWSLKFSMGSKTGGKAGGGTFICILELDSTGL